MQLEVPDLETHVEPVSMEDAVIAQLADLVETAVNATPAARLKEWMESPTPPAVISAPDDLLARVADAMIGSTEWCISGMCGYVC